MINRALDNMFNVNCKIYIFFVQNAQWLISSAEESFLFHFLSIFLGGGFGSSSLIFKIFTEAQLSTETLVGATCFHSIIALQVHHKCRVDIYFTACKTILLSPHFQKSKPLHPVFVFFVFFHILLRCFINIQRKLLVAEHGTAANSEGPLETSWNFFTPASQAQHTGTVTCFSSHVLVLLSQRHM